MMSNTGEQCETNCGNALVNCVGVVRSQTVAGDVLMTGNEPLATAVFVKSIW